MTDYIERLRKTCAQAGRPATHFSVADVRQLLAEIDMVRLENDALSDSILELVAQCESLEAARPGYEMAPMPLPNGSVLMLPRTEEGEDFAKACTTAAVDARHEWEHPR